MEMTAMLDELARRARREDALAEKLLATRNEEKPVDAFCRVCQEEGYEIYPMDLISAGEDFYAAMRRSTNGGGENSPMLRCEDDYYEMFLSEINLDTTRL